MNEKIIQKIKKSNKGRTPGAMEFPFVDIVKTLEVIKTINKKSSLGIKQSLLAPHLGSKFHSGKFKNLIRSAYRYGMTTISYGQDDLDVKISELGKKFLKPRKPEDEKNIMFEFFQNAKLFDQYYQKLLNETLPEPQFGKNQISDLGNLSEASGKIAFDVFSKNLTLLSLLGKNDIVLSEPHSKQSIEQQESDDEITDDEITDDEITDDEITDDKTFSHEKQHIPTEILEPKVFVSHSKNKKILVQLGKILTSADIKYTLVIDKPETAISIKDKVFESVEDCNCGLVNISADDENLVTISDDKKYVININVAIEIGALIATYKKNVILLWDKRIDIPTILNGINRINYEGDLLEVDAVLELQSTIKSFKNNLNPP